jgi:hypothetical protein
MAHSPLLNLPPELRLCIYREFMVTCLLEDTAAEILNLVLTCHQFHQEIEDEYISKARTFTHHRHICILWADLVSWGGGRYRLQLPEDKELTAIPAPKNPRTTHQTDLSDPDPYNYNYTSACLCCVFQIPHPTRKFHHGFDTNYGDLQFREVGMLMHYADTSMLDEPSPERVIFQCHARDDEDLVNLEDAVFDELHRHWIESNNKNEDFFFQRSPPERCRSWRAKTVAGKNATWSFGFDYAEDLPEFPGAVYD